jgi:hypothetical protein
MTLTLIDEYGDERKDLKIPENSELISEKLISDLL